MDIPCSWQYEISRFEATRDRRHMFKCGRTGFCTVWNADPQALLDKVDPDGFQWDKIIVLHRSWEDMLLAHALYMKLPLFEPKDLLYPYHIIKQITDKAPRFTHITRLKWEKYERYYTTTYNPQRVIRLHLDDLNNHTKHEFTRVLDFLEVPKENRPIMIATKTWRFWELHGNERPVGAVKHGQVAKIQALLELDKKCM